MTASPAVEFAFLRFSDLHGDMCPCRSLIDALDFCPQMCQAEILPCNSTWGIRSCVYDAVLLWRAAVRKNCFGKAVWPTKRVPIIYMQGQWNNLSGRKPWAGSELPSYRLSGSYYIPLRYRVQARRPYASRCGR